MDAGYQVHLGHGAASKRYEVLKRSGDAADAAYLAQPLRLGLLPEGYIYSREQRAARDLARRRNSVRAMLHGAGGVDREPRCPSHRCAASLCPGQANDGRSSELTRVAARRRAGTQGQSRDLRNTTATDCDPRETAGWVRQTTGRLPP